MDTPILIYCADGNKRYATMAQQHGWLYGSQIVGKTFYYNPVFVDQNWKNPQPDLYFKAIRRLKPYSATVIDIENNTTYKEALRWAEIIAPYVNDIIFIPKVDIIADLPRVVKQTPTRLGYSVPTKYAGTDVPFDAFIDAHIGIHLLGGSPTAQFKLWQYAGKSVTSLDNNYIHKTGTWGVYWGRYTPIWRKDIKFNGDMPYHIFRHNLVNMWAAFNGVHVGLRYGSSDDIQHVKRIANQYKNELGFVNRAALETAIRKHQLWVAYDNGGAILGFANWHARRDGWHTVYEIAVDKNYTGQGIGSALLNAVPSPKQLSVTQDNSARLFYESNGIHIAYEKRGKKRPLYFMRSR